MNEKIKAKAQELYPPEEKASEYVAFLRGARIADKTIVEKACEWLATEEEKARLFNAIKANGYRWNPKTKSLEKLPKFKVGDKIEKCGYRYTIKEVREYHYLTKCGNLIAIANQDNWELAPNKFDITTLKPFEKVLVRQNVNGKWGIDFFGFYTEGYYYTTGSSIYVQCIPYEENKHLIGTTNNCDEYYKTWE